MQCSPAGRSLHLRIKLDLISSFGGFVACYLEALEDSVGLARESCRSAMLLEESNSIKYHSE